MSIDITAAGVSMDEVAKDEDSSYRPDGEPEAAANKVVNKVAAPNGGQWNAGGTPGNKGGTGRPPSEIRQVCREKGYDAIQVLAGMLEAHESKETLLSPTEAIRLADVLSKYGVGSTIQYTMGSPETLKLVIETVERLYPGVISATKVVDSVMEQLK